MHPLLKSLLRLNATTATKIYRARIYNWSLRLASFLSIQMRYSSFVIRYSVYIFKIIQDVLVSVLLSAHLFLLPFMFGLNTHSCIPLFVHSFNSIHVLRFGLYLNSLFVSPSSFSVPLVRHSTPFSSFILLSLLVLSKWEYFFVFFNLSSFPSLFFSLYSLH
jgi:hypothetical protein